MKQLKIKNTTKSYPLKGKPMCSSNIQYQIKEYTDINKILGAKDINLYDVKRNQYK